MVYQTRKAVVSLISNVAVYFILFNKFGLLTNNDNQVWGQFFIVLLGLMIATNIVVTIIFNIIHDIFSQHEAPKKFDERDHTIELKAVRNFCFVLSFFFFASMTTLAFQQPMSTMLLVMATAVFAAMITLYTSYIFFYQRGY